MVLFTEGCTKHFRPRHRSGLRFDNVASHLLLCAGIFACDCLGRVALAATAAELLGKVRHDGVSIPTSEPDDQRPTRVQLEQAERAAASHSRDTLDLAVLRVHLEGRVGATLVLHSDEP